ncbi:MAG: hypothetical protein DRG30_08725 [Epsilonproteobacteria bacterium]|nr:MAG: hypothetical protein DRG30_08725 [Campylobacterota bacterium]
MKNEIKKIDRDYVVLRVTDWKQRLDHLFSDISDWSKNVKEDIEIKQYDIPQAREELMSKFDVEPMTINSLVLSDTDSRASFIPLGLWVIGSNGRVNISTKKHQYILFDLGDDNTSPLWTLVNPTHRKERISFNKEALTKIIKDEELFE